MHIPDGYLGPPTWGGALAICVPLWTIASRKVKSALDARRVPLMAIAAAFSFLIMMFNVPIPGGTTGHAVGGVLVAIAIGPWAASLAITIALVVQALFFGDGGVTSIGANCLNMAFVLPCIGFWTYRSLCRVLPRGDKCQAFAAAVGGWVGLNAAAIMAALMFGVQPLLHTGADGHALYAPYPLSVAVPAMVFGHLFFGIIEGLVTGLAVYALLRSKSAWIVTGEAVHERI